MPNLSSEELNEIYKKAEEVDKDVFAEQRSNLLLIAGEHYSKRGRKEFLQNIRNTESLKDDQKLRITKNHIQKINGSYVNSLLSDSPNITIVPDIETELQDQKAAELNKAVWQDACQKYKLPEKFRNYANDFCGIGEVCVKLSWDETAGKLTGYEPLLRQLDFPLQDPETDEVRTHEQVLGLDGQPLPDKKKPVFEGGFDFHRVFGFNLLRSPEAQEFSDSEYLIERKMVDIKTLKKRYQTDPKKMAYVVKDEEETFMIFEGVSHSYKREKNKVMVLEFYYKPSVIYPNGYFYMKTNAGILEQGELPFGIFPYVYKEFDSIPTSARGFSKIKQLRPYQVEINRCSSAIATHQITLGDDKLVTNTSGKIEHGGFLPGVRLVKVPGGAQLTHLPGRSGEQYLPYMQQQISEMYEVANVAEMNMEKQLGADPYSLLFASAKQKKSFSTYAVKFEEFLVSIGELYLELARQYLPDEMLIPAIGRREMVNIEEFRSMEPLGYKIKVEPQSDNIESQFGKQMVMNHALQYVGGQLSPDQLGTVLKNMPLANMGDTFDEMMIDQENVKNDMLALERGEQVQADQNENHVYTIKKLTHRMKQSDFPYLDEEIQMAYEDKRAQHQQLEAQNQQAIQKAQSGFIPADGYMVKVDFYTTDENGKTKRATLPYASVQWLVEKLEQQGQSQEQLSQMQEEAQAGVAREMVGNPDQVNNGQSDPNQG